MTRLLLAFKLQGFELSESPCAAVASQSVSSGRGRAEQNVWEWSDADAPGGCLSLSLSLSRSLLLSVHRRPLSGWFPPCVTIFLSFHKIPKKKFTSPRITMCLRPVDEIPRNSESILDTVYCTTFCKVFAKTHPVMSQRVQLHLPCRVSDNTGSLMSVVSVPLQRCWSFSQAFDGARQ